MKINWFKIEDITTLDLISGIIYYNYYYKYSNFIKYLQQGYWCNDCKGTIEDCECYDYCEECKIGPCICKFKIKFFTWITHNLSIKNMQQIEQEFNIKILDKIKKEYEEEKKSYLFS